MTRTRIVVSLAALIAAVWALAFAAAWMLDVASRLSEPYRTAANIASFLTVSTIAAIALFWAAVHAEGRDA